MSTALSASIDRGLGLPAFARIVPMTGSLAYHVAGPTVLDGLLLEPVGKPSPADVAEAERKLGEAEFACRPVEPLTVRAWCDRLVRVLPKAPGREDIANAVNSVWLACHDLPTAVWTAETVAEALAAFEWWPPPAKVRTLLLPHAERFWRARAGLQRVSQYRAPEEAPAAPRAAPTQAEIALVTEALTGFMAGRSWNQPNAAPEVVGVRPAYLSDGVLLATWEAALAAGVPGAAVRVNQIRDQLLRFPKKEQERRDENFAENFASEEGQNQAPGEGADSLHEHAI